jgi:hypothetical protein
LNYLKVYSSVKTTSSNTSLNWMASEDTSSLIGLGDDLPVETDKDLQLLVKMSSSRVMNIDPILSTASIYLNLSRALTLSQDYEIGAILLTMTEAFIQETKSSSLRLSMENRRKSEPFDTAEPSSRTRGTSAKQAIGGGSNSSSIILFLQHRSSELSREVSLLKTYLTQNRGEAAANLPQTKNILKGYSKTLLLHHLRHGPEEELENGVDVTRTKQETRDLWKAKIQTDVLTQLNEVFGLKNIFRNLPNQKRLVSSVMKALLSTIKEIPLMAIEGTSDLIQGTTSGYCLNFPALLQSHLTNSNGSKRKDVSGALSQRKKKRVENTIQEEDEEASPDGQYSAIQETKLLSPLIDPSQDLDIKMEICSGSGEWIVEQAVEYQRLDQLLLASVPFSWGIQFEGPQEVRSLLEVRSNSEDFMNDIFHAEKIAATNDLLNDGVGAQRNSLAIDFAKSTLVD